MARILIVDDDSEITGVVGTLASAMGYDVVTHTDPREAAKERGFDVLLTDFMMPGLSGIELIRALRPANPDAVRMMITAASDFKVAVQAVNDGEVFRLVGKPWHINDLRAALKQAVDFGALAKENKRLSTELSSRNVELLDLTQQLGQKVIARTNALFEGMIRALDYRDTETQWHSWRVSRFTKRIAEEIGATGEALATIEQGALLHDIGKIGVPDSILLKNGPLSPAEWMLMRLHPDYGHRMLAGIDFLKDVSAIVYQHQERWDGKGYPQGLKGEEIVLGARIFAIADTLDAISSDRPYRAGRSLDAAVDEIAGLGGTQFDPTLVQGFLKIPRSEWQRIRDDVALLESNSQSATGR